MKRLATIIIVASAIASTSAAACGVCIDDKVAIVYDHAIVVNALAAQRVVVFAEIKSSADANTLVKDLRRAAANARGVDRNSIRTAAAPAALSFVLDPRLQSPKAALDAISRHTNVELALLRVMQ